MHLLRDPLPAPRRRAPLTRVIGLGSPFGGDRAGWEVVERLRAQVDPAVDCVAIDRPGAGLLAWLDGIERLILVDALLGAADSGFSVLSADQLAAQGARIDSHRLDLGQALALAGALGQAPGEVKVYAIHIVAEDLEQARPEVQGRSRLWPQISPKVSEHRHLRVDCGLAVPHGAAPEREYSLSAEDAVPRRHDARHVTPGILPSALRASLRQFKIAPGDFVEPLDFIARLAALVPKPRVNLTRFHGIFAPNSKYRARVTPAKRGRGGRHARAADPEEPTPAERRAAMTWAQRLKRVFGIDIETCPACGGAMRIIACIEDPDVIDKILTHLDAKTAEPEGPRGPPCRAPPQASLFD